MMRITWLRRSALALVAALALAVVGAMGPTTQEASAASSGKLCWVVWEDGKAKVYCIDIQVQWPWDKIFECWMCGLGLDWTHDPVIREDIEGLVGQQVVNGLSTLGTANFTSDPAQRAALRARALDQFTAAARYAGTSRMRLAGAGLADPVNNRFDPSPDPWMQAAGIDAADGVTLLQQAAANPRDAARLRDQAMREFDEAYQELSEQRAIG